VKPSDGTEEANAQKSEGASASIPDLERLKLWVRSGGRCAICNTYLLEDDFTGQVFNFGEMAHNVGRKQSSLSPRGLDPLPLTDRNKAENLLLLCEKHHKLIDHKIKQSEYSVDDLLKIKHAHEDRIKYLTSMGPDQQTTILRVVGDIRGRAVELSREHVRKTVSANASRYPYFALAFQGQDFEIDLRGLPDEGTPLYWQVGEARLREALLHRLAEGVQRGEIRHLSLFAIARIPLLISLGYMLDDKIPVDLYGKHRDGEESWFWSEQEPVVEFEHHQVQTGTDGTKVGILLNLSGTIHVNELPDHIGPEYFIFVIAPVGVTPNRNILRARGSLDNFSSSYHSLLSELERGHKAAREVHLFAAVPVTAAVVCGRGLMRDAQPAVIVYDRTDHGYEIALEVNRQ
jgi:hypothetical protein